MTWQSEPNHQNKKTDYVSKIERRKKRGAQKELSSNLLSFVAINRSGHKDFHCCSIITRRESFLALLDEFSHKQWISGQT